MLNPCLNWLCMFLCNSSLKGFSGGPCEGVRAAGTFPSMSWKKCVDKSRTGIERLAYVKDSARSHQK